MFQMKDKYELGQKSSDIILPLVLALELHDPSLLSFITSCTTYAEFKRKERKYQDVILKNTSLLKNISDQRMSFTNPSNGRPISKFVTKLLLRERQECKSKGVTHSESKSKT